MAYGDRKSGRVDFERGIRVYIMGIDGTWRRECMMVDVSQTGARLRIEGSAEGLDLKEFFLLVKMRPQAGKNVLENVPAFIEQRHGLSLREVMQRIACEFV